VVVVSGTISAAAVSLVVLPVVYAAFGRIRQRVENWRAAREAAEAAASL
jgi:Cu/Ag efflux pump CusA